MIQRYDVDEEHLKRNKFGEFILYVDHLAVIAEKNKEIKRLEWWLKQHGFIFTEVQND